MALPPSLWIKHRCSAAEVPTNAGLQPVLRAVADGADGFADGRCPAPRVSQSEAALLRATWAEEKSVAAALERGLLGEFRVHRP
jgi:hypothetical protein